MANSVEDKVIFDKDAEDNCRWKQNFFFGGKNFQIPTRDIILWISVTDHPKFCQSRGIFSPSVDLSTDFSFNNFTPFFFFFEWIPDEFRSIFKKKFKNF
jgi:hypothetical protein